MASLFTKIVKGEIPAYKVAEDENYLAFLDIFPIQKGHVLVIPKLEVDYLFDLDTDVYAGLWAFAQKVSKAQKLSINCNRIGVAVLGMEVPHAHIHLVPISHESDLSFSLPKKKFTDDEFKAIAQDISNHII